MWKYKNSVSLLVIQKPVEFGATTPKKGYAVTTSYQHQHLVIVPEDDPLEAISRQGAQRMLSVALEREVEEYLERQRYVRYVAESEVSRLSQWLRSRAPGDHRQWHHQSAGASSEPHTG